MPEALALVTARGGSKGFPGKNLAPLGGKPLIAWTIQCALQSRRVSRVLVSTDDEAIARVSRDFGAEVPFLRPTELARDDSPHILSALHALEWLAEREGTVPEYLVLLQPTSPLRAPKDIDAVVDLAYAKNAIAVVSVVEAKPHPYKTYGLAEDGTLVDLVPSSIAYRRRQDLPPAFADNGAIYMNRSDSLLRERTFIPVGSIPYRMPPERSLDIDSAWDLQLAEFFLRMSGSWEASR